MTAITITPDSTRYDLMDALAREGFGIEEPDAMLVNDTDAYSWRWFVGELVQQMDEDEFRSAFDYICRTHDVDTIELDAVAYVVMKVLRCTPKAAAALREYVFDGISDTITDLTEFESYLTAAGAWYLDDDALKSDGYIERDGALYEKQDDAELVPCEANVLYDVSYGYLVIWC